jgi:hypothetical protein
MKLSKRTIWAVAVGIAACTGAAQAAGPVAAPKPAAPVVQLPPGDQSVAIPTAMGGPTVSLPYRGGIDVAGSSPPVAVAAAQAPIVAMPESSGTAPARTPEPGPVVELPPH